MTTDEKRKDRVIGWVLAAVLLVGCLAVLLPFMTAIVWALVLSFSAWPLYRRMLAMVGGRRTWAALLMTLGTMLVLLVPLLLVAVSLADNVKELTAAIQHRLEVGPPPPPSWVAKIPVIGERASAAWASAVGDGQRFTKALEKYIQPALSWLLASGLTLGRGLFELTMSIFIAFFFYRDGVVMAENAKRGAHRIAGENGERLLELAGNTIRSVVYGILGTALIQGVMAGIGFWIAGVPGAGLLGLLTFFLSIVPMGPPLIWIPATIWLFSHHSAGWGVFMLIWGLGVSSVDNVVKPWLISRGSDLPFIIILLGVLGGAFAFGFIGVFLGPTLLAVCYRLLTEWTATNAAEVKSA